MEAPSEVWYESFERGLIVKAVSSRVEATSAIEETDGVKSLASIDSLVAI